ncbi:hypothetical protein CRE_08371 [Caenorhabditis remanei]|uniref:Uncharacterized protein n=1 Tax=Caenorhabditis remanei TaxID=31234 RepID=E3MPD8_CAERE|nr:hypothetical protein CRE_08371 [Caenorhabditis remanei]
MRILAKLIFVLISITIRIHAERRVPRFATNGYIEFWGKYTCSACDVWCLSVSYMERDSLKDDTVFDMPNICGKRNQVLEHYKKLDYFWSELGLADEYAPGLDILHNCSTDGMTLEIEHNFRRQRASKECGSYEYSFHLNDDGYDSSTNFSAYFELPRYEFFKYPWGEKPSEFPTEGCSGEQEKEIEKKKTTVSTEPVTTTVPTTTTSTTTTMPIFQYLRENCSEADLASYQKSAANFSSSDNSGQPEPPRSIHHTFNHHPKNFKNSSSSYKSNLTIHIRVDNITVERDAAKVLNSISPKINYEEYPVKSITTFDGEYDHYDIFINCGIHIICNRSPQFCRIGAGIHAYMPIGKHYSMKLTLQDPEILSLIPNSVKGSISVDGNYLKVKNKKFRIVMTLGSSK